VSRVIVLIMHGAPPRDFPRQEAAEFFGLFSRLKQTIGPERAAMEERHAEIEAKMRAWPRTPQNDPFHAASQEMADQLRQVTGGEVIVGFGEFCAPTMDEAMEEAAGLSPKQVIVITPMMTRGGEHSEVEIPAAVRRAEERHPDTPFLYVWPFHLPDVARFLAGQIERFDSTASYR
jgi:sirohydrochlorin cobaltochelatase